MGKQDAAPDPVAGDWSAWCGQIIDGALCHSQNSGGLSDVQHIASKTKPALGGPYALRVVSSICWMASVISVAYKSSKKRTCDSYMSHFCAASPVPQTP